MSTFWLKVIASDHVFYDGSCEALVVPAHDGEVGILPHREAMILASQEGELRFRIPGETDWHRAVVGLGIVQVANNRVTGMVPQECWGQNPIPMPAAIRLRTDSVVSLSNTI